MQRIVHSTNCPGNELSVCHAIDLIDLRKCSFSELRTIDSQTLPPQTFIQACKDYVNNGFNPVVEACVCNGGCATKKCLCKAAKVPRGTRCRFAKKKSCTNI